MISMATNRRGGSRPTHSKVPMVQPAPKKPSEMSIFADDELKKKLIKTLRLMKNNRSYTVLEYHQNWASVHFEGDHEPKSITYRDK